MKQNAVKPGEFEYLSYMKKKQGIKTIVLFIMPIAVFLLGYFSTHTKANLLTVVAVCGLLPACKSLVELIMYLRAKGCPEQLKDELTDKVQGLTHSYGMVFTTTDQGVFEIPSIVVKNNTICGFSINPKAKLAVLEKHIATIMKQNGYKVVVKIFDKKDAYFTRLSQLRALETQDEKCDEAQAHLLHNISL